MNSDTRRHIQQVAHAAATLYNASWRHLTLEARCSPDAQRIDFYRDDQVFKSVEVGNGASWYVHTLVLHSPNLNQVHYLGHDPAEAVRQWAKALVKALA